MAKKKTKSTTKPAAKTSSKSSKSHGQLFDSHPNLIWLLPVFLLIAAVAVIMYKNSLNPIATDNMLQVEQIPQNISNETTPPAATATPQAGY